MSQCLPEQLLQPGLLCWPRFPSSDLKTAPPTQTNTQPCSLSLLLPLIGSEKRKKCALLTLFSLHFPEYINWCELQLQFHLSGAGRAFFFVRGSQMRTTAPHHLHLSWENTDKQVTEILSQVIGHLSVWEILQCNIILCKSQTVNNRSQAI